MNIIKLSATTSTNDFLKELSATQSLEDFTVAWAELQTKGKGQMGTHWVAEAAKNLTFSIFLGGNALKIKDLFSLNVMVANAVLNALDTFNLPHIYVKWPNDILSYNKKIAGILIENNIKANGNIQTIIGIGMNVLQTNFDEFPNASSIYKQYGVVVQREELIEKIVGNLRETLANFEQNADHQWDLYHKRLFKKEMVSTFENDQKERFSGIIKKVNRQGQLVVQLENDDLKAFNLKEIKLLY